MADKMMRMAGRGEDGLAKALGTDLQGNLKTKGSNDVLHSVNTEFTIPVDGTHKISVSSEAPYLEVSIRYYGNYYSEVRYSGYEVSSGTRFLMQQKVIYDEDNAMINLTIPNLGNQQEIVINNTSGIVMRVLGVFVRAKETDSKSGQTPRLQPVTLGGKTNSQFQGTGTLTSDPIDVSKYKNLSILVENDSGSPIWITVILRVRGQDRNITFYDWNTESWVEHTQKSGTTFLPSKKFFVYDLSTHPNFYWLKDLNANEIKVRAIAENAENATGIFRVWLGGDSIA